MKIGLSIRNIRLKQNRTIQEIANNCELSKSMVSKIETDKVFPSVATLTKLAKSLGVTVSALLAENEETQSEVITARKAENNITNTERGYSIYPFASGFKEKKMQPFLFIAKKGEVKEHHLSHEGEEFIHMLQGVMKFQVGDIEYVLKKGDSLYFNSIEPHQVVPVSETVKYLDIFV